MVVGWQVFATSSLGACSSSAVNASPDQRRGRRGSEAGPKTLGRSARVGQSGDLRVGSDLGGDVVRVRASRSLAAATRHGWVLDVLGRDDVAGGGSRDSERWLLLLNRLLLLNGLLLLLRGGLLLPLLLGHVPHRHVSDGCLALALSSSFAVAVLAGAREDDVLGRVVTDE